MPMPEMKRLDYPPMTQLLAEAGERFKDDPELPSILDQVARMMADDQATIRRLSKMVDDYAAQIGAIREKVHSVSRLMVEELADAMVMQAINDPSLRQYPRVA
jgi:hypothetical protein